MSDPAPLQRRERPLAILLQVALLGWALLSGCGPSFEVLAEGDLRFVHCDRLDLDPKIAPSHRLQCWREWRRMYTYGQTRDRVDYAQRRIAEVVSGDAEAPFQLPEGEASTVRRHARVGVKPDALALPSPVPAPVGATPATPPASTAMAPVPDPALLACRNRCEAANATCAPGCETRPTGCQRCAQPLEACLAECKPSTPTATPPPAPAGGVKEPPP